MESRFYGLRSAIKSFGIERFKSNCVKATAGFNIVLERLASQQHQLVRMRQEKLEEFKHIKEEFKHQYRERTEVLKEKSSQQWNQAGGYNNNMVRTGIYILKNISVSRGGGQNVHRGKINNYGVGGEIIWEEK